MLRHNYGSQGFGRPSARLAPAMLEVAKAETMASCVDAGIAIYADARLSDA